MTEQIQVFTSFPAFWLLAVIAFASMLPFHSTQGYLITSPATENNSWYYGHSKLLKWTSVSTDPPKFALAIVNNDPSTYPMGLNKLFKSGISKSHSQYLIPATAIKGLKEGTGYQINILSQEGGAILAQSPLFTVSRREPSDTSDEDDYMPFGRKKTSPKKNHDRQDGGSDVDSDEDDDKEDEDEDDEDDNDQEHGGGYKEDASRGETDGEHHNDNYHGKDTKHKNGDNKRKQDDKDGEDVWNDYFRRRKLRKSKLKSDKLLRSIPKFDHSRGGCSRSPPNPRVAKVLLA